MLDGTLDLAIVNEPSESASLTQLKIDETPFYVAMLRQDTLAKDKQATFGSLDKRDLVLFERKLHPVLYDLIFENLQQSRARAGDVDHVTAPEEAFPYLLQGSVAIVVKAGALLLARSGVTVRPLVDHSFSLRTFIVSRSDNDSRVVSELVRGFVRKLTQISSSNERVLPLFRFNQ